MAFLTCVVRQLWRLVEDEDPTVSWNCEFIASLTGHMQTVNIVRFSPDGMWRVAQARPDSGLTLWVHRHHPCVRWRWYVSMLALLV